jgi:hypothetical protein
MELEFVVRDVGKWGDIDSRATLFVDRAMAFNSWIFFADAGSA